MPRARWSDTFYVRCYELARAGHSDQDIAAQLGVSPGTFVHWKSNKPALRDSLDRGRKAPGAAATNTFRDYIYARLPAHLQSLWEQINLCEEVPDGTARLEALLSGAGERARQHLFFYALISSGFNASEACRKVNISKRTLDGWVKSDPGFAELLDEVNWHKGNFFESHLIERVAEGDTPATVFANRTFNRDRGYGDKLTMDGAVDHRHAHAHAHFHGTVADLNLPLELKRELLHYMRLAREKKGAADADEGGSARAAGLPEGRELPLRLGRFVAEGGVEGQEPAGGRPPAVGEGGTGAA